LPSISELQSLTASIAAAPTAIANRQTKAVATAAAVAASTDPYELYLRASRITLQTDQVNDAQDTVLHTMTLRLGKRETPLFEPKRADAPTPGVAKT
jgi:hypothetical protein